MMPRTSDFLKIVEFTSASEDDYLSTVPKSGDFIPKHKKPILLLLASSVEGVGVFAGSAIAKGTRLSLFAQAEKVRKMRIRNVPFPFRRYIVPEDELFAWGPTNFNRMSIGWYLNHGLPANVCPKWNALRDIREGEEILVDYDAL